tara:strand:+ start:1380 stop:3443 length:2064 start_codon:yes stop_codon:yes gene_type:complete
MYKSVDALYESKVRNSDDVCVRCIGDIEIPRELRREDDMIEFDEYGKKVIDKCKELGLYVFSYYGPQRKNIFSLISVPLNVLKRFAIKNKITMMLDPRILKEQCKRGYPGVGVGPLDINEDPKYSPMSPYDYIHARYTEKVDSNLYWRPKSLNKNEHQEKKNAEVQKFFSIDTLRSYLSLSAFHDHENIDIEPDSFYRSRDVSSPFRELVRLQLTGMLMESRTENNEKSALSMHKYLADGHIVAYFCLHDRYKSAKIMDEWFDYKIYFTYFAYGRHMKYIKEYFGEKTCLYFRFVQHYSKWLIGLSIVGFLVQFLIVKVHHIDSGIILPYYSWMVSVWSMAMLLFWKRSEYTDALYWGQTDFKDHEMVLPEFRGEVIKSFIDGKETIYFDPWIKTFNRYTSVAAVIGLVMISIATVSYIYVLKNEVLSGMIGMVNAQYIASALSGLQIATYNALYSSIAIFLTEYENHRTGSQFEDAMISKLFVFQFVNNYASCFYIAFVAKNLEVPDGSPEGSVGACGGPNCMEILSQNLVIIFAVQIFNGSLARIGPAFVMSMWSRLKYLWITQQPAVSGEEHAISRPEIEYLLQTNDVVIQSIANYMNIAIQFGYMVLFITALPYAPIFVFISNIITLQCDVWSILYIYQRPIPNAAEEIGTWNTMFLLVVYVGVVTNAGIVTFTLTQFDIYPL